jgi:hypothetical protein
MKGLKSSGEICAYCNQIIYEICGCASSNKEEWEEHKSTNVALKRELRKAMGFLKWAQGLADALGSDLSEKEILTKEKLKVFITKLQKNNKGS